MRFIFISSRFPAQNFLPTWTEPEHSKLACNHRPTLQEFSLILWKFLIGICTHWSMMNIADFRCPESGQIYKSLGGVDTFVPAVLPRRFLTTRDWFSLCRKLTQR